MYDVTYTDDGTQRIDYYLWNKEAGKFVNQRTARLKYTPTGKVAMSQTDSYYKGELEDKEKYVKTYNEKDRLVLIKSSHNTIKTLTGRVGMAAIIWSGLMMIRGVCFRR